MITANLHINYREPEPDTRDLVGRWRGVRYTNILVRESNGSAKGGIGVN